MGVPGASASCTCDVDGAKAKATVPSLIIRDTRVHSLRVHRNGYHMP